MLRRLTLPREFFDEPPLEKLAPLGGRELRAANEHGGQFFDEPPPEKLAPLRGGAVHEVTSVGVLL